MSVLLVAGYDEPTLLGRWPGYRRGAAETLAVSERHAFVLVQGAGVHVIDISHPEKTTHVGEYRGDTDFHEIAISGPHAYLISYSSLAVLDLTTPTSPTLLGSLGVYGLGITVAGPRAYVSGGIKTSPLSPDNGFLMVDVSDRARPRLLGQFVTSAAGVPKLAVSGSLVYAVGRHWEDRQQPWRHVLQVIDTADPLAPQRVGSFELNRTPTSFAYLDWAVAVAGNVAYVAGPDETLSTNAPGLALWVIDTARPDQLGQLAKIGLSGKTGEVSLVASDPYLYVANSESGLEIIDISSPADPKPVGSGAPDTAGKGMAIADGHAYLASTVDGLRVVDVADRKSPRRAGRCLTDGSSIALAVTDAYVYLVEERPFRLRVLEVAQPGLPQQVGEWDGIWAEDVDLTRAAIVASGNTVYVAASGFDATSETSPGGVLVVDVTDPRAPEYAGILSAEGPGWQVCDVKTKVHETYVLSEKSNLVPATDGVALEVFDVQDRRTPRRLSRYTFAGGAWYGRAKLALAGTYAYVAAMAFSVVDISDPSAPREVGRYPLGEGGPTSLVVSGGHAYVGRVGEWIDSGLVVLDIADPEHPRAVTQFAEVGVQAMALWGRHLYAFGHGFSGAGSGVFDLLYPGTPQPAAFTFDCGWGGGAQASVDRLYVHAAEEGLLIYGIPPRPAFVGQTAQPDGTLALSWNPQGLGLRLQRSSSLANPRWVDAVGSTSTNRVTVPLPEGAGFFRLASP